MNRNNIWIHIGIAVVIVTFAAVLGQIRRWETSLKGTVTSRASDPVVKPVRPVLRAINDEAELLVRFKPGVSVDEIKRIAARNNDLVEDEYEAVRGLVAIDDQDDADVESLVRQYSAMSDLVEYAQPNYEIRIPDEDTAVSTRDLLLRRTSGRPNDPQFEQQWALNNLGQDGGSERAD